MNNGPMKEYITIKDFGPLKDIARMEIRPVTVLIGESASGKSTLMKVVAMMRYLFKMANIRSYLHHSNVTRSPFKIRFDKMMAATGMSSMLKAETAISYEAIMPNGTSYTLNVKEKHLGRLPLIAREDLVFTKVSFISENRNVIPMWAEKASVNAGATLGFYFHETNRDFASASEADGVLELKHVGLRLHITHPKGKPVRYRIEHDDTEHTQIDLREASSGIQTSVPLVLIVNHFAHTFSFKDAFNRSVLNYLHEINRLTKFHPVTEAAELEKIIYVHIEEPELSLFPDAQCKLVDHLLHTAQHTAADRSMNVMIATHSPYILNYLNVVLHQTKDGRAKVESADMAIYRLYEGLAQNLMVQDEQGRMMVDTYDLTEMMGRIYQEFTTLQG